MGPEKVQSSGGYCQEIYYGSDSDSESEKGQRVKNNDGEADAGYDSSDDEGIEITQVSAQGFVADGVSYYIAPRGATPIAQASHVIRYKRDDLLGIREQMIEQGLLTPSEGGMSLQERSNSASSDKGSAAGRDPQ